MIFKRVLLNLGWLITKDTPERYKTIDSIASINIIHSYVLPSSSSTLNSLSLNGAVEGSLRNISLGIRSIFPENDKP